MMSLDREHFHIIFYNLLFSTVLVPKYTVTTVILIYQNIAYVYRRAPTTTKTKEMKMTLSASRSRHATTIKVFMAILTMFILSYVPSILVHRRVFHNFYITYFYFINHMGNAVAYYAINRKFRRCVNKLFVKSI